MAPSSASTKRFLFLTMPKTRDYAKSVSESSSDLYRQNVALNVGDGGGVGDAPGYYLLHMCAGCGEGGCEVLEGDL